MCALGGVIVSRLKEEAKQDDAHTDALDKSIPTVAPGTAPLFGAWPLRELGVHKALIEIPYLRRDQESELRTALAARKPVLVVGKFDVRQDMMIDQP